MQPGWAARSLAVATALVSATTSSATNLIPQPKDKSRVFNVQRRLLQEYVTTDLANVRVPVLCLTAQHDRVIPNAAAHLIRHHAPAATFVEIDAPHFLLQCRPSDAADAIRMFLEPDAAGYLG